ILVGSPDIRVLPFGEDMKLPADWPQALAKVRKQPGVVAAAPFVHTQGVINAGHDYVEGVAIVGLEPQSRDAADVTEIRKHAVQGDFRFASSDGKGRGVALGKLLAIRLNAYPGDSITLLTLGGTKVNPVLGTAEPNIHRLEVTGIFETGMYEYDN